MTEYLKNKMAKYFKDHDGEIVYPSDLAEEFDLDHITAIELVCELHRLGEIEIAQK